MKEWTVMFYANGNNELEPETWSALLQLKEFAKSEDIYIVTQIAREEKIITKTIRPNDEYVQIDDCWSGVRRYEISHHNMQLIEALPLVNMAAPATLLDFLIWAKELFPANHYMLIVGGHIYQFVGISPDFTHDKPYILGFPELSTAIQIACQSKQFQIDIMILDTCYASTMETLCELGKYNVPAVKYMLTYIGKGPIKGLPYNLLLEVLQNNLSDDSETILKEIIKLMPKYNFFYPLIGLKIDPIILKLCKQKFSEIAYTYLINKDSFSMQFSPYDLLTISNKNTPWTPLVEYMLVAIKMLIVAFNNQATNENILPIHVLYQNIPDEQRRLLYKRLHFAKDNYWTHLLCNSNVNDTISYPQPKFEPVVISQLVLHSFIWNMNTDLSFEEQKKITHDLIKLNKWSF